MNQQRLVVEEVYGYGARVRLRARGGLQAGAARGHGDDRGRVGADDRLQRLQGRQLHRGGDPRDQARPHDHPGGRELRRARPDPEARPRLRRAAAHRRARQARERGRRAAGASRRARNRSSACSSPRSSSCSGCCKEQGMEDCLQLVHCHPGSQLQDIRRVKDAVNELAHVYAELKLMGAGLRYIDVGGGLGVDYDGSRTNYASSMNYTIAEYASDVVYRIASVCNARGIEHPVIVSESGRAIAAHHSLLVFNALGSSALDRSASASRTRDGGGDDASAAAGARPARRLPLDHRAAARRVLPRRAAGARAGAADVQPRLPEPRAPRPGRAAVLGDLREDPRLLPPARRPCPRSSRASRRS